MRGQISMMHRHDFGEDCFHLATAAFAPENCAGGSPRQPKQRWSDRRQRIIEVASLHINRFGPADIDLRRIASDCGLSRSTLYHYVKDRSDLVEDCLDKALGHIEWAAQQARQNASAANTIEDFVRRSLDKSGRYTCALSDFGFLGPERSQPLSQRANAVRDSLRDIVESGIASGEFAACNPQIAADLVLGAINWTKVAAIWGSFADAESVWQIAIDALVGLALRGIAAGISPRGLEEAPIAGVVPDSMFWKSAFDAEARARARREEICRVATTMFNERGISATTVEDIAKILGVTIGAIYHAYPGKPDLVHACYARSYDIYSTFIEFVEARGFSGIGQVYNLLLCHAYSQIGPWTTMRGQSGVEGLRVHGKNDIMSRHRDVVARSAQFYENAMADGTAHGVDALLLSSAAAGAISWLPSHQPNDRSDALAKSRIVARQLLQGLLQRD
ncbi:TetR family transcriptional regulator [Novosphingobium sp. MW5]|nr:TetR family transcriptional regulator [Novosphingobium sp. MW5]